jgi:transcription antitermination factor NusG
MSGWTVVLTRPGGEDVAARCCERQGYVVYMPKIWSRRSRRSIPLFPRYLFVWIDRVWWSLRSTPGVSRVLVSDAGTPALVRAEYIGRLRGMEKPQGDEMVIQLPGRDWFRVGQKLRVRDRWHLLAERELIFSGMSGADRVRVLMTWMGREQSVVLDKNLVAAA